MNQRKIFNFIKERIIQIQKSKNNAVRVAINGIEGTGKTVFCEKLTEFLNENKLTAVQISIDGYHNFKNIRYRQGRDSATGYYKDAYNEYQFVENVLKSSQNHSPFYVEKIHNIETDEEIEPVKKYLTQKHILLTDGAYLFKEIYRNHWDLKIYLKTDFETAQKRGIERDIDLLGGFESTKEKYEKRYHAASRIYIDENKPTDLADIVIDNTDFENLIILKNRNSR
jgi:uridine kinase